MVLAPKLELKATQSLVMTPQLQQAIKLLQLSNVELEVFVREEMERNPLLDSEDEKLAAGEESPGTAEPEAAPSGEENFLETAGNDADLDMDVDNVFTGDDRPLDGLADGLGGAGAVWEEKAAPRDFSDSAPAYEETLSETPDLHDHLREQVGEEMTDPGDRLIAAGLIDSLEEDGYFREDASTVAEALGCEPERVERVLAHMKKFDPPGIFSTDLAECLGRQLALKNRLDPAMKALLDNLELLGRQEFDALEKICGVGRGDLADMATEIQALNPRPAAMFDTSAIQAVSPDVLVSRTGDGQWRVDLNHRTLPRLLVNNAYYAEIRETATQKADKKYLNDRLQAANWLVRALHQRATTILKTATELVKLQGNFLDKGIAHLKPLTLKDIAERVEMHESTISRVTTNKYMATPRGLFEMKYFFTQSLAGTDGESTHSAETVRHRIRSLIEEEPPEKILSDDRLASILKAEGVAVARRTVAKYREAMHIPSSSIRRRQKKNSGL